MTSTTCQVCRQPVSSAPSELGLHGRCARRLAVAPRPYFELLDEIDPSLPVERMTKESLMAAGYSESDAEARMAIADGRNEGCCVNAKNRELWIFIPIVVFAVLTSVYALLSPTH